MPTSVVLRYEQLPWRLKILQVDSRTEGSSLLTEMRGLASYCNVSLFCDGMPVVVVLAFITRFK